MYNHIYVKFVDITVCTWSSKREFLTSRNVSFEKFVTSAISYAIRLVYAIKIHGKFILKNLRSQFDSKSHFWLFFTDFHDFKPQYLRQHTSYYSLSMSDTWGNIQGTSWYDQNDLSTPTAKVIWKNTFFWPVHLKWPFRTEKVKWSS